MKLDRNINPDGLGRYAVIDLRKLDEIQREKLREGGSVMLPTSAITLGEPDQFFVLKYKDKFAPAALKAYAEAVHKEALSIGTSNPDDPRYRELYEFGCEMEWEVVNAERRQHKIPD